MKEDAKKKGCCKDEHKEFKLKTDQQKASVADYIKVFSEPIIKPEFQFYIIAKSSVTKPCYNYYRPTPNIFIQNLQVLYCSFLI